jgi:Tol biopolymer transport system component
LAGQKSVRGYTSLECTPDGKWVVFPKSQPEWGIWKVPIGGGEPVRLNTAQYAFSPAVSPDGRALAYSYQDLSGNDVVEVMPLEGNKPAKRFDIATPTIRWSPDSRSILYIKNEGGVSNIWSQPLSGEPTKPITHFNSEGIRSFDMSRDGRQLVMNRGTANRDVVLIRDVK